MGDIIFMSINGTHLDISTGGIMFKNRAVTSVYLLANENLVSPIDSMPSDEPLSLLGAPKGCEFSFWSFSAADAITEFEIDAACAK